MHKGQHYRTGLGLRITVNRVARDHSRAWITVTDQRGVSWGKVQRLVDGKIPYATELVEDPAEVAR